MQYIENAHGKRKQLCLVHIWKEKWFHIILVGINITLFWNKWSWY